ncbi:tail fiber domain-containing protein [Pseudobdellovibrio sp. HCB154]|uniref:tail fiber domain-containing protein n=1 Tax=Pseudobdellovibrio sp. HCB154 TaxID=3386277 RepID=UPI0039171781
MKQTIRWHFFIFFAYLFAAPAWAVPGLTTYQARIIKPNGVALEESGVSFRFTVLNPAENCILYIEDYGAINMTNTSGLASFSLGSGTKTYPTSGSVTFQDIFNNSTPSLSCQTAGTYTPGVNDIRKLIMQFNDGNGWQTLPPMSINAVPYAMYATKADNAVLFNNKADTAFVQYSAIPTCTGSQALQYTGSGFVCITAGGGSSGTITAGDIVAALGYTPGASGAVSSQWTTSGSAIYYNSGFLGVNTANPTIELDVNGRLAVSQGTFANPSITFSPNRNVGFFDDSNILGVSIQGAAKWFFGASHMGSYAAGGALGFTNTATSPALTFSSGTNTGIYFPLSTNLAVTTNGSEKMRVTSGGLVGIGTTTPVTKLDVSGAIRISMDSATCAASYAGAIRYNAGIVEVCDGSTWASMSGGGSVTSATVISALGYTPANPATLSTSFTTTASFSTLNASVTSLGSSITTLNSSYSSLAASMAALSSTTSGIPVYSNSNNSIFVGSGTAKTSTTADNTTLGVNTLKSITTANKNVAIGTNAMMNTLYGSANVAVGHNSMYNNTIGDYNTAVGHLAMYENTTGWSNTAFGSWALYRIVDGWYNTGIGESSLDRVTSGTENVALGASAGRAVITGQGNTFIGTQSGEGQGPALSNVSGNTFLGFLTGQDILTGGNNNTLIGYRVGDTLTTGSKNIVIGYNIDTLTPTSSNTLNIGNLIYGTNLNGQNTAISSGSIGIGETSPLQKLSVSGVLLVSGEYGSGESLVVSGAGTRMFFYPKKSAFRAGYAGADEWDDANISDGSIAMGDGATAFGYGAISLGTGTFASGTNAVAIGRYSNATGDKATAFGESQAEGDLSTSFDSSYAGGMYSVAMGSSSANGDRSISIGPSANADGEASVAIGQSTLSRAYRGIAVGSYNVGNGSGTAWVATDPIFEIGNSQNGSPRSNALTVLKNGSIGIGVTTPTYTLDVSGVVNAKGLKINGVDAGSVTSSSVIAALSYTPANSATVATLSSSYTSLAASMAAISASGTQWTTSGANIFYNAGNVGVGVTNPSAKLEVIGDVGILASSTEAEGVKFHTTFSNNETSSRMVLAERQDNAYGWSFVTAGVANPVLGGTTLTGLPAGTFSIVRHSGSAVGAAALTINRETGNVGIGTTTPSAKLEVVGGGVSYTNAFVVSTNAADGGTIILGDDANNGDQVRIGVNGYLRSQAGRFGIDSTGAPVTFEINGAERMRVSASGTVGIGTTSPIGILDVRGGAAAAGVHGTPVYINAQNASSGNSNGGNINLIPGTGTGTGYRGSVQIASGTFYNAAQLEIGSGAPGIAINNTGNSQILLNHAAGGWGVVGNNAAGKWSLGYANSGSTNLDGSVLTWTNTGSVGIGTSSPVARLSVESAGATGIQMKKSGSAAIDTFNMINDMDATGYFWFAKGSSATAAPTTTNRLIGITNEGNVEIYGQQVDGTTDKSGVLSLKTEASGDGGTKNEVSMEFYADRADLNTSSGFVGFESGTTFNLSLVNNKAGSLILGTSGNTALTINSSRNVGIGTTTPAYKLSVYEAAASVTNNVESGNNGSAAYTRHSGKTTGGVSQTYGSGLNISDGNGGYEIYDFTAGASRMFVSSTGNVGIGTITPGYKLDVSGDLRITGTPYRNGGDSNWIVPSDARLKDVGGKYNRGLREIASIETIYFNYKKDNPKQIDSSVTYTGVLAQEVKKQIPEAVKEDKEGFLSLNTTPIFWAMVNAIKEIYYNINGIKEENAQLKVQAAEQARKIQSLEAENAAIKERLDRLEKSR